MRTSEHWLLMYKKACSVRMCANSEVNWELSDSRIIPEFYHKITSQFFSKILIKNHAILQILLQSIIYLL